jgi:hypothetical protein
MQINQAMPTPVTTQIPVTIPTNPSVPISVPLNIGAPIIKTNSDLDKSGFGGLRMQGMARTSNLIFSSPQILQNQVKGLSHTIPEA